MEGNFKAKKDLIVKREVITIEEHKVELDINVTWDIHPIVTCDMDPSDVAECFIDNLDLHEAHIDFDRHGFSIDGKDIHGRQIAISQSGEFDMYGGPYTPKMQKGTIMIDGKDYFDEVNAYLLKEYGDNPQEGMPSLNAEWEDIARIDLYYHLIEHKPEIVKAS